jgi:hypothetical protein
VARLFRSRDVLFKLLAQLRLSPMEEPFMHTLVNHLPIKEDADWTEMTRAFDGMCRLAQTD